MLLRFALCFVFLPVLSFAEPRAGCQDVKKTARFTVYFERVELEKLVQTVSDATCKSFIVAEGVKGKISIVGPENGRLMLDAEQFYAAFLAALDANALAAVPSGKFIRIVEKRSARQFPIPVLDDNDLASDGLDVVTRLRKVSFIDLESVRPAVSAFLSAGGDIVPVPPDLLIITDLASNQKRIERVIDLLDVARPPTEISRLTQVRFASVDEIVDKVTRVLAPKPGSKAPADVLTALPDERTNRILLVGPSSLVDRAEQLIHDLDIEVPGDNRARVVRLKNADAKDLAATLEAMTGGGGQRKAPVPPGTTNGATTGEVRISINEAINALLIVSSAGDFRALSEVIEQLDRPVRQVFIETVIMEVNVQRDSKLGVSLHGTGGSSNAAFVYGSQPEGTPSSLSLQSLSRASGLLFGLQGPALTQIADLLGISIPAFGITVQASQGTSDVNVLSMPHILTADNKEAEIAVGQKVPFQLGVNQAQVASLLASGNSTAASLSQLTGNISREKVELKLTVKPHIGDQGDIRLDINQQAEELANITNAAGPITSTRGQKTSVVAKDNETLVLGGIMQDRELETTSKVPLLGDIPILGTLFRNTSKTKTKVNLLVFLTPHVISTAADFKRLVEQKMAERAQVLAQLSSARAAEEERHVNYQNRPGPLAALAKGIAREEQRIIAPSDQRL
jgi:general secretion pathway protein D